MSDISAVITAHREGVMAGVSLKSLLCATEVARAGGLEVEVLVMLDNPDETTRAVFADADREGWVVETVSLGDQGMVRNHAVELARGRYVAFLDADDLWSENWLSAAYRMCSTDPGKIIAHPEVDWFFGSVNSLFFHADQTDPGFDPHLLRFMNYWDALCLAPREAYLEHPFSTRAVRDGFAFEDWHWNCETLDAGFVHRVVPDTIHFKRRREGSQTLQASGNKCLTRDTPLLRYDWEPTDRAV